MDNQEYKQISNENIESAGESSESEDEHQVDDIDEDPNWYPDSEEEGRPEVRSPYQLRSRRVWRDKESEQKVATPERS
ncbi:unnamed protein product [Nezara viridula]|uniref:Uncharacterized protein n=1 Tax=Nezara viridula TaxID=85310 RepID=A0A9P0E9S5_NEZVI|nr:unnamed protein product [Nezara viridula]